MAELLEDPDAARTVWEFLDSKPSIAAYGLIPNPRPTEFVRVRLGGGSARDVATTQPTVFVESYSATYDGARALARRCDAYLMQAAELGWLGAVAVRSIAVISKPQDLLDPLTDQPRCTATYAPILHRSPVTVP